MFVYNKYLATYFFFKQKSQLRKLGCIHTCSSVRLVYLVWTKNKNYKFGPGPLSVHTGIFDEEEQEEKVRLT